ncbi:hypothetical protein [Bradyrhizobium sp.]|uniref:hypothetical protein n=1 Tax=Bradyrhizobium sp. TaxID=376 RepID=UPI003C4D1D95
MRRDPPRQQLGLPLSRFRQREIGAPPEARGVYACNVTMANQQDDRHWAETSCLLIRRSKRVDTQFSDRHTQSCVLVRVERGRIFGHTGAGTAS